MIAEKKGKNTVARAVEISGTRAACCFLATMSCDGASPKRARQHAAELATPGALLASARTLEESAASLLARAAVLRRRADAEGAVLPTRLTHGMPSNIWARIVSSVLPEERLKLPYVCAAWREACQDKELWREMDIRLGSLHSSYSSSGRLQFDIGGVFRSEFYALGRKAQGGLRKLLMSGGLVLAKENSYEVTVDDFVALCLHSPELEVLKISWGAHLLTFEQINAVMAACPRLASLEVPYLALTANDAWRGRGVGDAVALLRGEGNLSKVAVRSLSVGLPPGDIPSYWKGGDADASVCAHARPTQDLVTPPCRLTCVSTQALASALEGARGRGLEALRLACPRLRRSAPLRAFTAGVVAAELSSLTLVSCKLSARESSGPLGWLISHAPSLRQLCIRNCRKAFTTDDASEADDAPLRAALQSSSLHSFTFIGCGLPCAPRATARLLLSLVGHPTLECLDVGAWEDQARHIDDSDDGRDDDEDVAGDALDDDGDEIPPPPPVALANATLLGDALGALASAPSPLRSLRAFVSAVAIDYEAAMQAQPSADTAAAGLTPLLAAIQTPGSALESLWLSVEGQPAGRIPPSFLRDHVLPAVACASALTEFQVTMRVYDP